MVTLEGPGRLFNHPVCGAVDQRRHPDVLLHPVDRARLFDDERASVLCAARGVQPQHAPLSARAMREMLMGGTEVGQAALIRFYVLHIAVLPVATIILIFPHIWRVRKDYGLAVNDAAEAVEPDDAALNNPVFGDIKPFLV